MFRLETGPGPETKKDKGLPCSFSHKFAHKSQLFNPTSPAQEQEANKRKREKAFVPISGAEMVGATHTGILDQGSSLKPSDFTLDFVNYP